MTIGKRHPLPRAAAPLAVSFLVCAWLAASLGCSSQDEGREAADVVRESPSTAPQDAGVSLSADEQRTGGITVATPGVEQRAGAISAAAVLQMDDTRTTRVGSLVEGVVVETRAQVGASVARGAQLATLHSHEVHEAWASYRRALAERRQATSELTFARDAEGRAERLLAAKAASRQEAQRAQTDRAAAEEALVIAESEVTRAGEELQHLGIRAAADANAEPQETVPVVAPVNGVVIERLVTPGTAVTPGTPLYVVSDLSQLWAVAEIDEAHLPEVGVGRTASLTVAAYPGRTFDGRVLAVGDTINPDSRRVTVRIAVENADRALKPQMFATVALATRETRDVLVLPAAAVQKVDQQPAVFVETAPGRFTVRRVRVGAERDGRVEVLEGLDRSARVAVSGAFLLKSKHVDAGQPE